MTCSAETIVEALVERARRLPDALAYTAGGESATNSGLHADVRALTGCLSSAGVVRGGRCALILPTGLDFIRACYAAQAVGAAPVAINPALPAAIIRARLSLIRADVAVTTAAVQSALGRDASVRAAILTMEELRRLSGRQEVRLPASDETAYLQFTSGTAGEPRAVVIRHGSLRAALAAAAERLGIREGEVVAGWVPLHHDLGLVRFVFSPLYCGCPAHLIQPSISNLGEWLRTVSRVRAAITAGPDFSYRLAARLVDPQSVDLTSLAVATNGGEPVRASTIEAFERTFGLEAVVRPGYGLAEATLGVASVGRGEPLRVDASGQVSCGRAYPGLEIRTVDAAGRPTPPGIDGEIVVRGTAVFAGYFDQEEATRETLRDGWLHTGDVGALDGDGHLYVKGRARALIKRGGATIVPREIEEQVDRLDGVRFSAAVGVVSAVTETEDVVVVVEVAVEDVGAEALLDRISEVVKETIGAGAGRTLLVPPRTIPRTANGKIRYGALRELVTGGTIG